VFFFVGCTNNSTDQVVVNLNLDIYEGVTEGNVLTFEYSQTININSTYKITNIEILSTGWGEFPYESYFIEENEFPKFKNEIDGYLTQISENSIPESIGYKLGSKAKMIITLSDGNSDITIHFYQNDSNEIAGSMIEYTDYQSIDFIHYFRSDDEIDYSIINRVL
jgi:hypothetical protein